MLKMISKIGGMQGVRLLPATMKVGLSFFMTLGERCLMRFGVIFLYF